MCLKHCLSQHVCSTKRLSLPQASRIMQARASLPYPRGPRSGQGYSVPVHQHLLTSSEPLTSTPRFPSFAGYTESLCCAGAPRLPTSGSELSLFILVSMQPYMPTENPPVAYTQFLHRRHSLHLRKKDWA